MTQRLWWKTLVTIVALTMAPAVSSDSGLAAVPERPNADNFSLPAPNGTRHRLDEYLGNYILVNFWATWCSPCIRELPSMQRIYKDMQGRGFEIIAIHVGPETPDLLALLERFAVSFTVLIDAGLELENWNVTGLPASFLLDPEGRVIYRAVGAVDWDAAAQRKLLGNLLDGSIGAAQNRNMPAAIM